MTEGERAILDAIDGCDRVVAYCDEALDRFRGRKAQGQLTLRTLIRRRQTRGQCWPRFGGAWQRRTNARSWCGALRYCGGHRVKQRDGRTKIVREPS